MATKGFRQKNNQLKGLITRKHTAIRKLEEQIAERRKEIAELEQQVKEAEITTTTTKEN